VNIFVPYILLQYMCTIQFWLYIVSDGYPFIYLGYKISCRNISKFMQWAINFTVLLICQYV